MERRIPRRTVLARGAAGAGVILFGAPGGKVAAAPGERGRNDGRPHLVGVAENQQEDAPMMSQPNKALWTPWAALWNGDLAIADEIIGPSFVAHFAPIGGSPEAVRGPEELKAWIGGIVGAFTDYSFTTEVGPIADDDKVAGRWVFRATYQGGIPGASATAVGTQVEYAGMDIFRVDDGKLVEYWLCADTLVLLQQVGVIPSS